MADIGKAYVQIIPSAKGISGSISTALGGEALAAGTSAGKTAGTSLVGALKGIIVAAGIGKLITDAITTGMDFDKSMSQVAATLGYSLQELHNPASQAAKDMEQLRTFAEEMGNTTVFSAKEAADALNYMALAGYDVNTSMKMLPSVLNLAAAGGMDLALASDMVTDSQSALGLSLDRTSQLVDEMAKTASNSNTSVEELGNAMLQIGATARNLGSGFIDLGNGQKVAYDGTQSLSMVLGVLADNSIKGAEGGTHLRNMLMSLQSPTGDAGKLLEQLGVEVYDAQGNMLPFIDIIQDLGASMEGLTEAEKTDIINTIFNKTDISAVNALLNTSKDRWKELGLAIIDSEGAAETMAEVQLDNLAGDIVKLKSAFETLQIAITDKLTPSLRGIATLGKDILDGIIDAIDKGDFSKLSTVGNQMVTAINNGIKAAPETAMALLNIVQGMVSSIGQAMPSIMAVGHEIVQNLLNAIVTGFPDIYLKGLEITTQIYLGIQSAIVKIAQAAAEMLPPFLNGITQRLPEILNKGVEIITNLVNGILQNLPALITAAFQIVTSLVTFLIQNAPTIIAAGAKMILNLVAGIIQNLPEIVKAIAQGLANFLSEVTKSLANIRSKGMEMLKNLAQGAIASIPELVKAIAQGIQNFLAEITRQLPTILAKGKEMLNKVAEGVRQAIPTLVSAIAAAIKSFIDEITRNLSSIAAKGKEMIESLAKGVRDNASAVVDAIKDALKKAADKVKDINWGDLGTNIVNGIAKGIEGARDTVINKIVDMCKAAWDKVKAFFGISSPSKLMFYAGEMIDEGLAKGITGNTKLVDDAMSRLSSAASSELSVSNNVTGQFETDNRMDILLAMLSNYLPEIAEKSNDNGVNVESLYDAFNRQMGWAIS